MTSSSRAAALLLASLLCSTSAFAQAEARVMVGRWSGTFRTVALTAGSGIAPRYSGTADFSPSMNGGISTVRVNLRVSSNVGAMTLEWGVSMGRCGSKLIMLENANQLPPLEVHVGGEAELTHELPMDLNPQASYQLGLFSGGHRQQNMVACANMKFDDRAR